MKIPRPLSAALVLSLFACATMPSLAADAGGWPRQPIRVLLPVAPGGTADAAMRIIQQPLSKKLGQPVIIENRPGGSAVIATQAVVKSPADGYTLGLVSTPFSANPAMLSRVPYDTRNDVTPVAFFWKSALTWSVRADSKFKSLADVIAAARKEPKSVSYGVGGLGQASHFSVAALERDAGIQMTVIAYRGAGPALNDVLGGQVDLLSSTVGTITAHVKDNKLRPLAVVSDRRVAQWPDVPTTAELGFAGIDTGEWFGFVGPANLPEDITNKLNQAINEVLQDQETQEKFAQLDLAAQAMAPAEFAAYLHQQIDRNSALARAAGVQAD